MSNIRAKPEGTTYSRGDSGLWDDGELIRLWNAQLDRIKNGGDGAANTTPHSDTEDSSDLRTEEGSSADDSSSSGGGERVEGTGCGRAFAALANAASTASPYSVAGGVAPATTAAHVGCPLPIGHLPAEVQALVQSFYVAGFEAGKYAAAHEHRKRSRD